MRKKGRTTRPRRGWRRGGQGGMNSAIVEDLSTKVEGEEEMGREETHKNKEDGEEREKREEIE